MQCDLLRGSMCLNCNAAFVSDVCLSCFYSLPRQASMPGTASAISTSLALARLMWWTLRRPPTWATQADGSSASTTQMSNSVAAITPVRCVVQFITLSIRLLQGVFLHWPRSLHISVPTPATLPEWRPVHWRLYYWQPLVHLLLLGWLHRSTMSNRWVMADTASCAVVLDTHCTLWMNETYLSKKSQEK